MLRTHLTITIFFILLILPYISNKLIFAIIALISTYLPDIDIKHSKIGRRKIFRPVQFFLSHRGFFHSYTFLFLITLFLLFFAPFLALGFFVGYASHLFADSFTPAGISPFHPLKIKFRGPIKTGGILEFFIFILFSAIDILMTLRYIFGT